MSRIAAGLSHAAPWIPLSAAAGTVASLFVISAGDVHLRGELSILVGLGFATLVGTLVTWLTAPRSTAARANPRAYAEIQQRIKSICARLSPYAVGAPDVPIGTKAATDLVRWVEERIDSSGGIDPVWSYGLGYQDAWTGIHRAEEELMGCLSRSELLAEVTQDCLRIKQSPLEAALARELRGIRVQLHRIPEDGSVKAEISAQLREIRRAINGYRDERWDGLIRARNRLVRSAMMTAWTAYAVLVLALALDAPPDMVAAGTVFFLVGALIGLMAQLRSDADRDEVVEDFGLASARLYQKVLLSGLAAIAGVILMPIISHASGLLATVPDLKTVFDVTENPGQLLLAAVFGLSPHLLFSKLASTAEKYKSDLAGTQVASPSPRKAGSETATPAAEEG